jgi:streptogramin lyase
MEENAGATAGARSRGDCTTSQRARLGHGCKLPGASARAYAVFVDDRDVVWLTDFGSNAIVRFDPKTRRFTQVELPSADAEVRQLHGRSGEVWGAESGVDGIVLVRTHWKRSVSRVENFRCVRRIERRSAALGCA